MGSASSIVLQVFIAGIVLVAALIGWWMATVMQRRENEATERVMDSLRDQVESARQELERNRSLRPFHVQQYMLNIIQRLADQTRVLESNVRSVEAARAERQAKINEQSSVLDIEHVSIAELEERKRAVRDYEHELRKLIERSQAESHVFFESGAVGLRAIEEEIESISQRLRERNDEVARVRNNIKDLERQSAALSVELNRLREAYNVVVSRRDRLHAAVDAVLEGEAVEVDGAKERVPAVDLRRTA